MPTTLEQLLSAKLPDKTHSYTERDTILYALGLGLGFDPLDEAQLRFVYEKGLQPLPTLPAVLGAATIRSLPIGIDYLKTVHGEQSLVLHRLPPVAGTVLTTSAIRSVSDKGADKGAVIVLQREVTDTATGDRIATLDMSLFCRGDGGIGSWGLPPAPPRKVPEREPDALCVVQTVPQAALIYRLSGDMNPLHAEPSVARNAGFERPILHGMCTYGIVGYAVTKTLADGDSSRVRSLSGRFSAPLFPGEEVQVQMWRETDGFAVRAVVPGRQVKVFDSAFAEVV